MTTPIVGGLSLFVIARNFSARRGTRRSRLRPLEGFWALSRINIRECVQTPRVGGARWKAAGDTVGRGKRQEWHKGRVKTNGRRREGTRWEHVSHTEIVNYSFVPRRVGVIWKRETVRAPGRVSRRHGWRERRRYRGEENGREQRTYAHARMGEREKDAGGCATRRGRENETMHFLFHRTVETRCLSRWWWGGRLCGGLCARGGRRKTRMRLMIYTLATVYYRLELVRGYHLFAFPFFFPLSVGLPRSPPLTFSA